MTKEYDGAISELKLLLENANNIPVNDSTLPYYKGFTAGIENAINMLELNNKPSLERGEIHMLQQQVYKKLLITLMEYEALLNNGFSEKQAITLMINPKPVSDTK